jgi:dTDP-4-amino-4,6-dideoxy-D-galactose acyltransferase
LLTAGYELHELDWDTKFFGMKMGEVLLPIVSKTIGFSELTWQRTLELAHYQNYQFLFCPFDVEHNEIAASISRLGATIGDILVTYSLQCTKDLKKRKLKYPVIEADQNDLPGIIEIAHKSFRDSRFLKDLHFERAKAEQFYPSWLRESFLNLEKILVVKENQQILGFVSLKPESTTPTLLIRLIAVNESTQGKGVGQTLIDQAINFALEQKYSRIQVGTQLTNYAAINLYEKNSFRMINAKYRYHFWLNQSSQVQELKFGESLH